MPELSKTTAFAAFLIFGTSAAYGQTSSHGETQMSAFDEFLAAQPGAPQAGARNVKLLCVTTVDGVRISDVLNVDYAAHTVNGRKAIFGQDEITFETPPDPGRQGRPTIHKLNRYDGSFYSYQEGALYPSPPPRLTCTVAPQRAF